MQNTVKLTVLTCLSPARPNPVRKRIKTRGATLHSFVLNTSLGGLSKEALCVLTVLPAMDPVYLDVSIWAAHNIRLHQTLFDGGDGVLGSDICPGYKRRLITLVTIAGLASGRDRRETAAGGGDHGENYRCMSLITNC